MSIDVNVLRAMANNADADLIRIFTENNPESIVLPLEDVFNTSQITYINIYGDLLHEDDNYFYFSNCKKVGKFYDITIYSRQTQFPITMKQNLDFFCSEQYIQMCEDIHPQEFLEGEHQLLELIVDRRTGQIMGEKYRYDLRTEAPVQIGICIDESEDIFIGAVKLLDNLNLNAKRSLISSLYRINSYNKKVKPIL